ERPYARIGHVSITAELVREGAHVAGALHVVLAAQRVDAHALTTHVAGRHGEVRDRHDRSAALAVLGDAQTVVDGAVTAGRIEARGTAHLVGRNASDTFHRLG